MCVCVNIIRTKSERSTNQNRRVFFWSDASTNEKASSKIFASFQNDVYSKVSHHASKGYQTKIVLGQQWRELFSQRLWPLHNWKLFTRDPFPDLLSYTPISSLGKHWPTNPLSQVLAVANFCFRMPCLDGMIKGWFPRVEPVGAWNRCMRLSNWSNVTVANHDQFRNMDRVMFSATTIYKLAVQLTVPGPVRHADLITRTVGGGKDAGL